MGICEVLKRMDGKSNKDAGRIAFNALKAGEITSEGMKDIEDIMGASGIDIYGPAAPILHVRWAAAPCMEPKEVEKLVVVMDAVAEFQRLGGTNVRLLETWIKEQGVLTGL